MNKYDDILCCDVMSYSLNIVFISSLRVVGECSTFKWFQVVSVCSELNAGYTFNFPEVMTKKFIFIDN